MHRYLTAFIVLLGLAAFVGQTQAQTLQPVSGYLSSGKTKVFFPRTPGNSATDTIYEIAGNYDVAGTLQIMEGAEVWFLPNSRIIDSTGGKIIANGFTGLNRRILFRGMPVNPNSVEWGHFLILPNADSAFFANVRFVNFRKRNTVDVTLIYSPSLDPVHAAFDAALNNAFNGNGGVIATMSRKTWIYDAIVDSCQTSFRGGAFAFLQSPAGWPTPDDGRLAVANGQVARLTIRDTRVFNNETSGVQDVMALGGAIYMASNGTAFNNANFVSTTLGYTPFTVGTTAFTANQNTMLFERCTANNTLGTSSGTTDFAKGGAIYVGSNTSLTLSNAIFNNDSAIAPNDANTWGGAIAVSATSGNPNQVPSGPGANGNDRLPGLTILKNATFAGNVAGKGGAINLDFLYGSSPALAPRLNIDAEHIVPFMPGFSGPVRDSGLIQFNGNIAYQVGGAIYSPNEVYITGYLAPQNFPWPGGIDSVDLRVHFFNNIASQGGGSIYLDGFSGGAPDLQERRSLHLRNSVNPFDARLNPTGGVNRGALYGMNVQGGGAEFVGMRDSSFAVEFNSNTVTGGNGGAVAIVDAISINSTATNRFFAENEYNAQNVRIARDSFATPFPYDPRELTRFLNNRVILGPDSGALYNYNSGVAHGRGGGIYIQITTPADNPLIPLDSTFFSRVRFEGNEAYSGSAIWSDRYDLKLMTNQCLIANNHASSTSSATVDLDASGISNPSDVNAGATIWADFEGALPSYETNSRGDAIYDNTARYILRLPVSPIVGRSGADTIRGTFWGETGPSVITEINPPTGPQQATFFIDYYKGCFTNVYEPNRGSAPFSYTPVTIGTIPDTLLMEGRVYDLFDKGTDMKVADYAFRRLAPAEAFALGIPNDVVKLHRFTRNIFDTNATYVNKIDLYQTDFVGPHPIGYPLFLQGDVSLADSNRDAYARNYTVFMVFNQNTNEFVRVNLKETMIDEGAGQTQQTYQGRLDFVPDSSITARHANFRQNTLYTLSLLRPSQMTFDEVQRASMLEDSAALAGREYQLSLADMQGSTAGDTVCTQGITGTTTWYAGERYHTLPVRPGDHILVISRTHLWKYGAAYAITHGLQFTIGDVLPPNFVADITNLQNDPYNPNVKFVHEDVNYDASDPAHTLFRVAGYDPNNFYDPRFLFNQGNYTQLALSVTPDLINGESIPAGLTAAERARAQDSLKAHIRLNHWLKQTTIFNQNITGSNGYILLTGQPHNPDVVPGGEALTVTATNFPPNFTSESGLLKGFPSLLGPDSSFLSMWVFPPYMNCTTGGFLSDTLCVRPTTSTYHFRIIVMDSLPRFLNVDQRPCAANLTDSLRYTYDLNTDDELEDAVAAAETLPAVHANDTNHYPAWDFRFGRTSYSFPTRPSWMVYPSGGNYVSTENSPSFTQNGIINVRVDSAFAVSLLTPNPQVNGELNLDTIAAVQAHDGHTGKALQRWPIPVNFAPTIITTSLPNAKEGVDYSLNFQDPQKINRIIITDPNVSDYHTYTLVYEGQTQVLYRDGLYKVGFEDATGKTKFVPDTIVGHTPAWLKIDPFSGVLTGTPSITDAPRTAGVCGDSAQVTVIVTDQCQLATYKTFKIAVDSVDHLPGFFRGPGQLCVMNHTHFCDSVKVFDLDLLRDSCINETLTIVSLDPRITVSPTTVKNTLVNDTTTLSVCGQYDEDNTYFFNNPPPPEYIRLKVTDASGNVDTITYAVHVGNQPKFECAITVSNAVTQLHPLQDAQILCFGAGPYGHDSLDIQYCEYEVAPAPPTSAFDARWILPLGGKLEGTTVDVRSDTNQSSLITWQVVFQAGNESGGAGSLYPVEICWKPSCLDPKNLTTPFNTGVFMLRNPRNRAEFDINMFNGNRAIDNSLYTWRSMGSDSMCLEIRDQGLTNAIIVFVPAGAGVNDGAAKPTFALQPNYPNPFASATTLNFSVAERSNVRIDIYDLKGTLVRTLVNEQLDPGAYPVTWDGTDASGATVSEGSYIAHMTAGSFTSSVKMSFEKVAK